MHVFLTPEGCESFLIAELARDWPGQPARCAGPRLLTLKVERSLDEPLPPLVFARQFLPKARACAAPSVRAWSELLCDELLGRLPHDMPWRLHVEPHYGGGTAGRHRCQLIREGVRELLRHRSRRRLRVWQTEPARFTPQEALAQLLLTAPDAGLLSIVHAPVPFCQRRLVSPFPKGEVPVASDKSAPCRAFAKLLEAELRLGRRIMGGETCVDLGAAPGSWSQVALLRGARVIAVDRAPLRADLMRHPRLSFRRGDAFAFDPERPVDWLLCDVIAAPQRSIELLLNWTRRRLARAFVVTIKFKGHGDYAKLDALKQALPPLAVEFFLTRLCANKNEATAFGVIADGLD